MLKTIELRCGDLHCVIAPDMGGSVVGLTKAGVPVLAPVALDTLKSGRDTCSYPLVPYSNRLGQAQLAWEGQHYNLTKNFGAEPHALHGTGWHNPWSVVAHSQTVAELALHHTPNAYWPFAFVAHQRFELNPQGIEMALSVTNLAPNPVPAGLGWHPYFVKRPDTRLSFVAKGRWDMGPDKLPTVCLPHPGLTCQVSDLVVDHCFEGWRGGAQLEDSVFRVQVRSDFDRLVVYTTPALQKIALEPVSHVNNAFNRVVVGQPPAEVLEQGVRRLVPNGAFAGSMTITVTHAA